jgi:hypothetical protein
VCRADGELTVLVFRLLLAKLLGLPQGLVARLLSRDSTSLRWERPGGG